MRVIRKNRQGSSETLPLLLKKPLPLQISIKSNSGPKFATGFTVVEILIVIAVISVLLTITMLSISLIFSRQLDGDARKLLEDIYWTREMTVSKHNNYIITIDTSNESYSISDAAGNAIKPQQRLKVNISSAPNTVTFQVPFATISLNPSGSSLITLTHEGKQRQISIHTQTGYAKIQ